VPARSAERREDDDVELLILLRAREIASVRGAEQEAELELAEGKELG
jgi:hypothetical protein